MKIGSCLLLLATPEDPLATAAIPHLAASGYDYAEVSLARLYPLSDREVLDYRGQFDAHHLPVEVFNNAIPRGMALVGPQADRDTLDAYIQRAITLAKAMGVEMITMSGPNRRSVPADFSWEVGFSQYVAFLKRFCDAAGQAGISLAIEPINHEEHGFVATVAEARRAVDAVGCPHLGVILDTYHFAKEQDSIGDLLALTRDGLLFHIHHAALERRTYPQAADFAQTQATLRPLLEAGYSGRISVEAYAENREGDLPVTSRLMQTLL